MTKTTIKKTKEQFILSVKTHDIKGKARNVCNIMQSFKDRLPVYVESVEHVIAQEFEARTCGPVPKDQGELAKHHELKTFLEALQTATEEHGGGNLNGFWRDQVELYNRLANACASERRTPSVQERLDALSWLESISVEMVALYAHAMQSEAA